MTVLDFLLVECCSFFFVCDTAVSSSSSVCHGDLFHFLVHLFCFMLCFQLFNFAQFSLIKSILSQILFTSWQSNLYLSLLFFHFFLSYNFKIIVLSSTLFFCSLFSLERYSSGAAIMFSFKCFHSSSMI